MAGEGEGAGARSDPASDGDGWGPMLAAYGTRRAAEDEAQRRVAEGPAGLDGDSVWVREMGWAQHLQGKDLVTLHTASQGPATAAVRAQLTDPAAQAEQNRLARLAAAFDRTLAHALKRLASVPHETLR